MVRRYAGALVLLCLLVTTVAAQQQVSECMRQCKPQDPDVNDPAERTNETVNVILYAHFFDIFNDAALNTLPPDPNIEQDLNDGFTMPSASTGTGTPADVTVRDGDFWMRPAGPLNRTDEGDVFAYGPYGVWNEVYLGEGPIVVYVYISPNSTGAERGGAVPAVYAAAQLLAGADQQGQGTMPVMAEGVAGPLSVVGSPTDDSVYEVRIELERQAPLLDSDPAGLIPSGASRIGVQFSQLDDASAQVTQPGWRVRTGPDFPWRMIVPVANPLATEELEVSAAEGSKAGNMSVEWRVRGAFGGYTVDVDRMELAALDAQGDLLPAARPDHVLDFSNDHDGARTALRATWFLDAALAQQADRFRLTTANSQGTFVLSEDFEIPADLASADDAESSAPAALATVLAVGIAGAAIRRRARR